MEIDKLEDNLNELSAELTTLKHITDGLDKYGDQQIYHWLKDVERIAGDNDEMQARLDTLRRPYASNNHNGSVELDEILIKELNVKVIESLEVVHSLKEQAFETFLLQITEDKLKRYSHDDLIMFTSEFSHKIGNGGFSNVYSGRLSDGVQVAAKVLKQNHYIPKDVIRDIFVTEVSTMIKASHPNLIKLYGFCFDDNMKALVYEYMENGSLDKVLFKKHIVVEWRRLYEIAIDTAKVLAYLHHDCDDQIIHHDIKSANILLDSNLSPKITDFGVAKIMSRDVTHFTMTRTRGTSCYIAPEMTMQASRVTCACDVYSFGMTLFDILGMRINSRTQPSFPNKVWRKFDKGKLDEIINECHICEEDAESARILSMIALWCIQFTPEIRPSMKDVVNVLEKNLHVAAPPNPFLASDKLCSIRQAQDMTYSTVSTSTHQSMPREKSTMDTLQKPMISILSNFDNRLSTLGSGGGSGGGIGISVDRDTEEKFEAAENIVLKYDSNTGTPQRHSLRWEESPGEAKDYLKAVDEILQLTEDLTLAPDGEFMDRAETVLQIAMSRLEEEFGHILTRNTVPLDTGRIYGSIRRVSLSFPSNGTDIDDYEASVDDDDAASVSYYHERGPRFLGDDLSVELIHSKAVEDLKEIAERMIRSRYEKECCQVFSSVRRKVLDESLTILGIEKLSIEEVQRIEWRALDEKMKKWNQAVKIVVRLLLPGEKHLCDQIFEESELIREVCFAETAKGCVIQLLNFGEAVAIGRRSSEKLFRILDMYEALKNALPDLEELFSDDSSDYVCSEANAILDGLSEAAKGTFAEFENAVQTETSRKPTQGGEIHPLTRYVMNYVKLLVDYSDSLNLLLESSTNAPDHVGGDDDDTLYSGIESPLGRRLLLLISTLESNLVEKSKLYEDGAMQYIFLMNNILYIVQKVKDSELGKLLGDHWVRKRRGQVRQYATGYLRASWSKALSCLKDEGIGGSGSSSSVSKVALKERFKSFNLCFEEVYRNQTQWKVPDPQLREELRISISEKVLPAYRSFLGRFRSHLESGRHAGKYIKYTPDDLENHLSDLFEGIPGLLHNPRRKVSS